MKTIWEITAIDEHNAVFQRYIPFGNGSFENNIIRRKGEMAENLIYDLYMKHYSGNTIISTNKFGSIMRLRNNPLFIIILALFY